MAAYSKKQVFKILHCRLCNVDVAESIFNKNGKCKCLLCDDATLKECYRCKEAHKMVCTQCLKQRIK